MRNGRAWVCHAMGQDASQLNARIDNAREGLRRLGQTP